MNDPIGSVIVELREDAGVSGWTTRIRGGEPGPGDAQGHGKFRRFIVVSDVDPGGRHPRAPIQSMLLGIRVYGTSREDAAVGYGLVSDALHHVGPRFGTGGFAIYATHHEGGGATALDPDTSQPRRDLTVEVVLSTMPA